MITRIRVEASAKSEEGLKDDLVGALETFKEIYGGEWEESDPLYTTTTKDGWWGFYVIKRKGQHGDPG